ncbi:uncharacterized protein B0H18DRAFT_1064999 [Fomitopsis serialis]|uniref:uncharacterized protein n=1 Tax=Fomitopsis serialis TaxID=139415 RepID=UPI002008CB03|nr:uncharacterized protein B0H18DRAFT_1064999 [Neoantrodia serialis]KAH9910985.1 hypothetical protein B0H18DRAFT_1064999 [Neoantrodia serialis]
MLECIQNADVRVAGPHTLSSHLKPPLWPYRTRTYLHNMQSRTVRYIVIGAAAGAVVLPIALPAILGAIGFTATGVLLGSTAAAIQSAMGASVPSGCLFAQAQSAAMGGIPLSWILCAIIVGAIIGGLLGALAAWLGDILAPHIPHMMRTARTALSHVARGVRYLGLRVRSWF